WRASVRLPRAPELAELSLDVLLSFLLFGVVEYLVGVAELDQVARAAAFRGIDIQEARLVGHALGLLEIVSHNRDGEAGLQLLHEFLDAACSNWVERG